jgi:hypothetical protein
MEGKSNRGGEDGVEIGQFGWLAAAEFLERIAETAGCIPLDDPLGRSTNTPFGRGNVCTVCWKSVGKEVGRGAGRLFIRLKANWLTWYTEGDADVLGANVQGVDGGRREWEEEQ